MNCEFRRTLLGIVKYPMILDRSSPQYHQGGIVDNVDSKYVKISAWKLKRDFS